MRRSRESDDLPVLAAWLLWEMFFAEDDGASDTASPKPTPEPKAPPPRAA